MDRRVVLVDDDAFELAGRRVLLERQDGIVVVDALTHAEALDPLRTWDGADVVVVDLWESHGTGFDRYPGVAVAAAVRRRFPRRLVDVVGTGERTGHVTVVAVSRHLGNDVLGRRLQEAGVDLRFDREDVELSDPVRFGAMLRRPDRYLAGPAGQAWRLSDAARSLGMTTHTAVNDLVTAAADQEPRALFVERRRYVDNAERHRWQSVMRALVPRYRLARPSTRSSGGSRPRGMSFDDLRNLLDEARGRDDRRGPSPRA